MREKKMETPPTPTTRNLRALGAEIDRFAAACDVRVHRFRCRPARVAGANPAVSPLRRSRRDAPKRAVPKTPQEAFPWAGLASRMA